MSRRHCLALALVKPTRILNRFFTAESFLNNNVIQGAELGSECSERNTVLGIALKQYSKCLMLYFYSFDLIFSNWLLMYLSDAELCSLTEKMLSWLRPSGYLFFRESCFHQSG